MSIRIRCLILRVSVPTLLLITTISAPLLAGSHVQRASAEEPKIEIGVILPLTGGWSDWGVSLRKSIDFATRHLGMTEQFSFHYEDEGECDARKAVTSYKSLRTRFGSKLFVIVCMNGTRAIKSIAQSEDALLLSAGFQGNEALERGGPVINYALQMNDEAALLALEARQLGIRKLAALRDPGTDSFVEGMRENFALSGATKLSLDIVLDSSGFEPRSIIAALKGHSIDGLFVNTSPQNMYQLLRALNEHRLSIPLISSYGFRDMIERTSFLRNFAFSVSYSFPKLSTRAESFERAFTQEFNERPRVNGLFVADMLEQLKAAIVECQGAKDTLCVRKSLTSGREIEGLSGRFKVLSDGSIRREFEIVRTVTNVVASANPTKRAARDESISGGIE